LMRWRKASWSVVKDETTTLPTGKRDYAPIRSNGGAASHKEGRGLIKFDDLVGEPERSNQQ